MLIPRSPAALFSITLLICVSLSTFIARVGICAQQPHQTSGQTSDSDLRGIKLYKQGDTLGAIEALHTEVRQHKNNGEAWLYLGLAFNRAGNAKNARKAFEVAVKLLPKSSAARTGLAYTLLLANKSREAAREAERALEVEPQNAEAHFVIGVVRLRDGEESNALKEADAALNIKSDFSAAILLKSQALIGLFTEENDLPGLGSFEKRDSRFKEAAASLERYLQLNPKDKENDLWREQLETLRVYAQLADPAATTRTVFRANEVTAKAHVISKPEPHYTEEARNADINGTVTLRMVLAADGTVKHILVLRSLSHGLTQQAIKAAEKIKFEPAIKDRHPVSQFVTVEYNFHLY